MSTREVRVSIHTWRHSTEECCCSLLSENRPRGELVGNAIAISLFVAWWGNERASLGTNKWVWCFWDYHGYGKHEKAYAGRNVFEKLVYWLFSFKILNLGFRLSTVFRMTTGPKWTTEVSNSVCYEMVKQWIFNWRKNTYNIFDLIEYGTKNNHVYLRGCYNYSPWPNKEWTTYWFNDRGRNIWPVNTVYCSVCMTTTRSATGEVCV